MLFCRLCEKLRDSEVSPCPAATHGPSAGENSYSSVKNRELDRNLLRRIQDPGHNLVFTCLTKMTVISLFDTSLVKKTAAWCYSCCALVGGLWRTPSFATTQRQTLGEVSSVPVHDLCTNHYYYGRLLLYDVAYSDGYHTVVAIHVLEVWRYMGQ